MNVKAIVKAIVQGRKEFTIDYKVYNELDIEIKKELDRNFWRFGGPNGYMFDEMDDEAKAHFANEEMIIRRSIFEC